MWTCKGTEEVNPVSSLILKVNAAMGFAVLDYDSTFPFLTKDDTLVSYLAKYNDKWIIDKTLEPRVGDTLIFSYKGEINGKLLGEASVTAGTIINESMQIPFMQGNRSSLKGLTTLSEVLIEGYQIEYVVRPKHFNLFTPITSAKDFLKAFKE